jgi:hypothetical protein
MQSNIINKHGKDSVQNFWIFVDSLSFDSSKKASSATKQLILKKLSPTLAGTYKDICDQLALSLYKQVYAVKGNQYIHYCYEAVSRGESFYENCWTNPDVIEAIISSVDKFNDFGSCFPVEDDYYCVPSEKTSSEEEFFEDDFEDYGTYEFRKRGKHDKFEEEV